MPLRSRTTQPQEVTAKDIFHVLVEYTTSDQIQALRERPQMLLYDYKYEASRQDRAAILRHSTLLKHLNTLNTTGVWCFKTLLEAVAKQDASIGRLMAMNPTHGEQAVRINATNLKSMLETCRAIKKGIKTGARIPAEIAATIEPLQLCPRSEEALQDDAHAAHDVNAGPSAPSRVGIGVRVTTGAHVDASQCVQATQSPKGNKTKTHPAIQALVSVRRHCVLQRAANRCREW